MKHLPPPAASRPPATLRIVVAALLAAAAPTFAAGGLGFTYGLYEHDATLGVDHVGILDTGNPFAGDTQCFAKRPILCVSVDGSPRPNYAVEAGQAFYQGWVEGHYASTIPVRGSNLTSPAVADGKCASAFGAGWRMAEFHDGIFVNGMGVDRFYGNASNSDSPWPQRASGHGGHTAWGFGHLRSDTRFWVRINDQPGNCWNP